MSDILTRFSLDDYYYSLQCTFKILTRSDNDPLKKWGSSIANTYNDPAITLLQHLVYEDKTSILVNMTRSFNEGKSHPVFHDLDFGDLGGGFRQLMNTRDIANYIRSHNESSPHKSKTLSLWARWLEGDRDVEDNLVHAIAARFWRNASENTRDFIRGITLYAHAHLFYNIGWNPVSRVHDLPALKTDRKSLLAGRSFPFASEKPVGSLLFNCIPRVPMSACTNAGFTLEESRTLYPVENMRVPFGSFGEDGIAIAGALGNQKVMYFLESPCEYENGALMVWDLMDYTM